MLAGDEIVRLLRFERSAIQAGEIWRLLTAHLTHLGWSHLMLNLAGLLLVWLLCGNSLPVRLWWVVLVVCALGVSLGLLLFDPSLKWYVGLSGVLHGLLVAGSIAAWSTGQRDSLLLLVAVGLKLAWEQMLGPLPGSEASAGGRVVVDAHLYGACTGALIMGVVLMVPAWRQRIRSTQDV